MCAFEFQLRVADAYKRVSLELDIIAPVLAEVY